MFEKEDPLKLEGDLLVAVGSAIGGIADVLPKARGKVGAISKFLTLAGKIASKVW